MAWLVAGLGNPGDRYAPTRHNVGRMVAEEIAREAGERFRKVRFLPVELAELRWTTSGSSWPAPRRFMNESGPSYASLAKKHDVEPDTRLAVHDELDIPAARIRLKLGGGNSGHNGLRSLDQALRTPDYLRVRVHRPPARTAGPIRLRAPTGRGSGRTDLALLVSHSPMPSER